MNKLPSPCSRRGCPEIVTGRYCADHQPEKWDGDKRPSSARRGYGTRHRKWRKAVLARDPVCVKCDERGETTPSKVADHIIPWQEGGEKYGLENGQGLCTACHNRKHGRQRVGGG